MGQRHLSTSFRNIQIFQFVSCFYQAYLLNFGGEGVLRIRIYFMRNRVRNSDSPILKKVWIANPRAQKATFWQKMCEIILDFSRIITDLLLSKCFFLYIRKNLKLKKNSLTSLCKTYCFLWVTNFQHQRHARIRQEERILLSAGQGWRQEGERKGAGTLL
jgi:hypothetical protein